VVLGDEAMKPLVSVIVPVLDRRELLGRCLDALAEQTVTDHEIVVVDDGSTDGSADAARAHPHAARIVVVPGDGRGAVAARRIGVAAASGAVLAFTDSDCEPRPTWLAAALAALDAAPSVGVVQGVTIPERPLRPGERSMSVGRDTRLYETCNVVYRRAAFEAVGGFDPELGRRLGFRRSERLRRLGFGEDALTGWRVRRAHGARFAPDAVVVHHVFPPDPVESIRRAWAAGGFPGLAAEVPELGDHLLRSGIALGTWRRVPLHAAMAIGIIGQPVVAVTMVAAWTAARARALAAEEPSWRRRATVVPTVLAEDVVTAVALAVGSVRARRVVL
jgi:glycosyltransferase involved in cell wall biosynthesis